MEHNITQDDKVFASVGFLSSLFSTDERTVQLWVKEKGMPKPEERGVYDLIACLKWKYNRQVEEIEMLKASGDERLHALKMEGQRIANKERELKLKKMLGELVDYDDVRVAWVGETKIFRKALNSMVPKLEASLEGINERARRRMIIQEKVKEVLTQIAENLKIETENTEFEELPDYIDELSGTDDETEDNFLGEE